MLTGRLPGVGSLRFIVPVAVAFAAVFLLLGRLAVKAQRAPAVTGVDGLLQTGGRTLAAIAPDTWARSWCTARSGALRAGRRSRPERPCR
jgi:hypothetical protein